MLSCKSGSLDLISHVVYDLLLSYNMCKRLSNTEDPVYIHIRFCEYFVPADTAAYHVDFEAITMEAYHTEIVLQTTSHGRSMSS